MADNRIDRGLEELAMHLTLDIEPVDPPEGLRNKIISGAAKQSNRFVTILSHWPKLAAVACSVLLVLYGIALYQIEQLKDKADTTQYVNTLGEVGIALGKVQKEVPLIAKQAKVNGKAYVLHGQNETRILIMGDGLKKKSATHVLQVWIHGKGNTRTVGAIEPKENGKATFSASVPDTAEAIFVTEETKYNLAPEGNVLLFSDGSINPTLIAEKEKSEDKQEPKQNKQDVEDKQTAYQPIWRDNNSSGEQEHKDSNNKNNGDDNDNRNPTKPREKPNGDDKGDDEQRDGGKDDGKDDGKNDNEKPRMQDYLISADVKLGKLIDLDIDLIKKRD